MKLTLDANHAKNPSEVKAASIPNPAVTLRLDVRSCLRTLTLTISEITLKRIASSHKAKIGKDSRLKICCTIPLFAIFKPIYDILLHKAGDRRLLPRGAEDC